MVSLPLLTVAVLYLLHIYKSCFPSESVLTALLISYEDIS